MKTWLGWIGNPPGADKYSKTPSRRDFLANGVDMRSLMTEDIPPLKFAVKPILPEGLVCIAGRPKAMKSWQMLKLCFCVENGLNYLGHEVEQGNALYLALEDSKRRLKERTFKLKHNDVQNFPTTDIEAPYLNNGLEEDLQRWIDGVKNPKLIVIDTLARVKQRVSGFNKGTAYDQDNELLRRIQQLAITNGVCIAFITHLSKAQQDYSFDKITGSVGLQGMTDAMWLIDRGDNSPNASITGRGRDILDFQYAVKWNDETMTYDFVGNKFEIELNENRKMILDAMKELKRSGKIEVRPIDIIKHLGATSNSKEGKRISRTIQRMASNYEITSVVGKYGLYKLNSEEDINHNHY
jgi:RecA-family ATPase